MNRLTEAPRKLAAASAYRYAVRIAGLALAYFLAARIGLEYAVIYPVISTIWPASGIALAAVLLGGLRLLPAVLIGAFAVNYSIQGSIPVSAITALGNSLEVLIGAVLLRRVLAFDLHVSRLRDVVFLIVVAATIAPLSAAVLGPLSLALFGGLAWSEFIHALRVWWMGDSLGIVIIAPLLLTWATRPALDWRSPRFWYVTALLAIQFAVCYAVFGGLLISDFGLGRATYFVLPFAVWIALAHDIRFTALANAGLFAIAVWGTVHGTGPFAGISVEIDLILLHIFLVVYSITTLLVATVNGERNRAVADADNSAKRFRRLSELTSDWYWEQDAELRFISVSSAIDQISGIPGSERTGKRRWEIENLLFDPANLEEHKRVLAERKAFSDFRYTRMRKDGELRHISITGAPLFGADGKFIGYRGIGKDITVEVEAERRLARLRDFYAALSKANVAIIHASDEPRLFDQVCDIAVTYGHVIFARICMINPQTSMLDNVAIAGNHQGYPDKAPISLDPARPQAHGPTAIALRTNKPDICNDIEADPLNLLWRPAMMATGARSYAVFPLQRGGKVVGSFHIYAAEKNWFDDELVALLAELVANISFALDNFERERSRQNAEAALKESEERFRSLTELSNDWYWEQDEHYRVTYMSPRYSAENGMSMKPTLGQTRFETDNIWESEEIKLAHRATLDARLPFQELRLARQDENGATHYMLISGRPVFDPAGRFTGYRGVGKDITTERVAAIRTARLKDFYAALSEVNNAIVHAQDRDQLFADVCKAVVEYGHLKFVRVALLDPATQLVRTVVHSGDDHGLSARLYFSMDPNASEGQAPSASALREGSHYICNDVAGDTGGILGKELLLAANLRSVATFPLTVAGVAAGALHLYATEAGFFDDELVDLIDKLTQNVSFALNNFEREGARRAAEKALRQSEQRFRDIAQAAGEFVWENDLEGRFTYVSPRVVDYTGYTAEEIVGHAAVEFMPPGEGERIRQWLEENTKPDRSFRSMEHMFLSKSGEVLWMQVSAVSIWDENGKPIGQRGTTRDISELKQSEARISYLATRDPLTELPNRLLFNDRLEQGIIAARRKRDKLGVLFLDLDRFKNINDSLGHHIGDLLLKEVSVRMASCIRKGDTLSRLGGDEFVVTLEGLAHSEDAAQVALKIITALRRPLSVGGHTLNTSCSIGISIFPDDAEDSSELMKNADTAMYHAKEQGRNNFQFFSPEMNLRAVERHRLETELRVALEQGQFILHYQPQSDIRGGRLVGMEALIRWQHPQRGLVPPASFIPVAEESGLIELIGRWALRTACEQIQSWQAAGLPIVKIAVNISARQFNSPKDFADEVTRVLNTVGLDPRYLELEMTESMLLKNVDENIAVLRKLGKLGTSLAVDDFGTGYSSLAYLKQLPIDTLKIDRTFVRDIETDADDAAIIKAIIAMAHSLGLRVTAEGVETQGQLSALQKLRCDQFQGYLISRPVPADEFAQRFLVPGVAVSHTTASGRKSVNIRPRKT